MLPTAPVSAVQSHNDPASCPHGVYAQRMNAAGGFVGGEFRINDTTSGAQTAPTLTGLADGGFLAAWESSGQDGSDYGVCARRYDASGTPVGGDVLLAQTTRSTTIGQRLCASRRRFHRVADGERRQRRYIGLVW